MLRLPGDRIWLRGWARRAYEWRELRRLSRLPRYTPTRTGLLGPPLQLVDAPSFLAQYGDIVLGQVYRFRSHTSSPVILDCGASIGVATLYWKQLYPAARVTAFEPDASVCRALRWNCQRWGVAGVQVVNCAVWVESGRARFWAEGADSGRLMTSGPQPNGTAATVETVRLKDYLRGPIDLLKLDIEGAEADVLLDCAASLPEIDHVFVECHSLIGQEQRLDAIFSTLRTSGFRIYLQPQVLIRSPFVTRLNYQGLDQTVCLFAYRSPKPR